MSKTRIFFYDRFPMPQCYGYDHDVQKENWSAKVLRTQKISAPWDQNWGRYEGSKNSPPNHVRL